MIFLVLNYQCAKIRIKEILTKTFLNEELRGKRNHSIKSLNNYVSKFK